MIKKILKFLFIIISFVYISVYSILFFYEKDILGEIMYTFNENIEGYLDMENIKINPLDDFPKIKIEFDNVKGLLKEKEVLKFQKMSITLNIWKLLFFKGFFGQNKRS